MDAIVSSPLLRCRAFAETLSERHGLPLALDDRLKEVGFGAWEGKSAAEIAKMVNSVMRGSFLKDPNLRREFLALLTRKNA